MATTETFEAQISVDLGDTNAALNQTYANMERLFRQVNEAGDEIETPFLKGLDSINRLRGNIDDVTDQLKLFGDAGANTASIIEGISDPVKRLAAARDALARVKQGGDPFAKMGDQVSLLRAKFSSLGPVTQGVLVGGFAAAGAAVAGAGAILVKFTSDALSKFIAGSVEMQGKISRLEMAYDRLTAKVGKVIAEHLHLSDALDNSQGAVEGLTTYIDQNSGAIDEVIDTIKEVGVVALKVFSYTLPAALTPLAGTIDALRFGFAALFAFLTEGAAQVGEGLAELGIINEDTAKGLRRAADDVTKQAAAQESLTKKVWETSGAFRDQLDKLDLTKTKMGEVSTTTEKTASAYKELLTRISKVDDELQSAAIGQMGDFAVELRKAGVGVSTLQTYTDNLTLSLIDGTITLGQYKDAIADLQGVSIAEPKAAEKPKGGGKNTKEEFKSEVLGKVGDVEIEQRDKQIEGVRASTEARIAEKAALNDEAAALQRFATASNEAITKAYATDPKEADASKKRIEDIGNAMNDAAKGAIMLGTSMAAMAIETAIAGESFDDFGWKMLKMFGDFAAQAGSIMLATGIGQLALFGGNPVGAIAAGATLIALGSVLGGVAKRNMKQGGGGGSSRAEAQQIIDSFADRNKRNEEEEKEIIIYAQFGTERLEPFVANATMSAERNGRLPRRARR